MVSDHINEFRYIPKCLKGSNRGLKSQFWILSTFVGGIHQRKWTRCKDTWIKAISRGFSVRKVSGGCLESTWELSRGCLTISMVSGLCLGGLSPPTKVDKMLGHLVKGNFEGNGCQEGAWRVSRVHLGFV